MKYFILFIISIALSSSSLAQNNGVATDKTTHATSFEISFINGKAHNHPSFVIWLEDVDGKFLQTLKVTQAVGTGIYPFKPTGQLQWEKAPGEGIRPAALPYWFHKRNIKHPHKSSLPSATNPVPDGVTGATPKSDFKLELHANQKLQGKVRVMVEVNQPWDVNEFWINAKYPENLEYLTSCQPALVYAVTIDFNQPMESYHLNPIGHSHPYGADGLLYTNLSTISTAFDIFREIRLIVK